MNNLEEILFVFLILVTPDGGFRKLAILPKLEEGGIIAISDRICIRF
jgi:hypothetical protein